MKFCVLTSKMLRVHHNLLCLHNLVLKSMWTLLTHVHVDTTTLAWFLVETFLHNLGHVRVISMPCIVHCELPMSVCKKKRPVEFCLKIYPRRRSKKPVFFRWWRKQWTYATNYRQNGGSYINTFPNFTKWLVKKLIQLENHWH